MSKRDDYRSWDDTFVGMSFVIAGRSKDPRTQVGAIIVSDENKVLSVGYNGAPPGLSDDDMYWGSSREFNDPLQTKYPYVIHAEENAISSYKGYKRDLEGGTIYSTHFPCNECAKDIAKAGIREVVYVHDYEYPLKPAAYTIFTSANVLVRKIEEYTGHIIPALNTGEKEVS